MNSAVELLAPAGNFDALVAAIQNGADAVYLGGARFGARAFAGNFSDEEIKQAIEYAHIRDVKIYVTVNTLIRDEDLQECLDFISFLYHNDVDAVILQDIGLASKVREIFPDLEIHASTQMSIANLEDARYYAELGFDRLVLSRENTIEEIRYIQENTGLEIESFVHGALCVSYSGKCLFSFANGGRSGNQGSCAQPCRRRYHLYEGNNKISMDYFLSTKDLCTIKDLKKIIDNGTHSLKIEGRMKRPEYVATVVSSYRKAIDALTTGTVIDLDRLEVEMASVFNRRFTKGLILNADAGSIVNTDSPHNIGVKLGKITRVDRRRKKVDIYLEEDLNKGDGLNLGEHVGRIILNKTVVEHAPKGKTVTLDHIGNAQVGQIVRKTNDKKLIDRANESLKKESVKIRVSSKVIIALNEYPIIEIRDAQDHIIRYQEFVEQTSEAQNRSLTKEDVISQIIKTEDTPYRFDRIDIILDDSVFLKRSTLNSLRRHGLALLSKKRAIKHHRSEKKYSIGSSEVISGPSIKSITPQMIRVKCLTQDQVDACSDLGVGSVYVDDLSLLAYSSEKGLKSFYCTPIMLKDHQIQSLDHILKEHRPHILTTSIGFANYVFNKYKGANIQREIRLDYLVNVYNKYTLKELGSSAHVSSVTLSLEHPLLADLSRSKELDRIAEIPVYIHPILMVTEFCPYKTQKPCKVCQVNGLTFSSEDKSSHFTIRRDRFCQMQLTDHRAMDHFSMIPTIKNMGADKYRIDLFKEDHRETKDLIIKLLGM